MAETAGYGSTLLCGAACLSVLLALDGGGQPRLALDRGRLQFLGIAEARDRRELRACEHAP